MKQDLSKKPNRFINGLLVFLFRPIFKYYFNFTYNREEIKNLKGPAIFISNHSSALDVFLMGISANPIAVNYVAGYEWFHNPILNFLLKRLKAIPKFQYQLDIDSIKEMFKVIEQNQVLGLFPTGRLSSDGKGFLVETNLAKLLKKLNAPVYFFRINGAYMSLPKWARKQRRGKIVGTYKLLFSSNQLEIASIEEITNIVNSYLNYDEYGWAKANNIGFNGRYLAEKIENIVYLCPKCDKEYTIKTKDNLIYCECGLKTKIDKIGEFEQGFYFKNLTQWNSFQKKRLVKELAEDKLKIIDECIVKESSTREKNKNNLGSALITLVDNNLVCKFKDDQKEMKLNLLGIKSLPFKAGKNFEIASGDKIYSFELINGKATSKWSLIVEALNEVNLNGN
jgi:1-acyl-sn-glycerol-3-phosphate acyltransferase